MCRKKAFMRMILASVTGPGLFQGHESRQVDENALEIFPPTVWKEALLQSQHQPRMSPSDERVELTNCDPI